MRQQDGFSKVQKLMAGYGVTPNRHNAWLRHELAFVQAKAYRKNDSAWFWFADTSAALRRYSWRTE